MRLQLGYVPLTDAAPVVAAAELGFGREEGLDLELSQEPSWATLRDRLALGHLDAAHMLAPLALASALGLSGPRADLVVPLGLSLNGNAITLSTDLWAAMAPEADDVPTAARAFARVAGERAAAGRPLTLGTVHPYSCHTYQLRLFAQAGGLDLRRSARLVVVPPPLTVDALRRGTIDGFCVGAPWNSIAVAAGLGRIAALGCEIVPDCPEKVLAVPSGGGEYGPALVRAIRRAGAWCADPGNRGDLGRLLVERAGLGPDAALVARTLAGDVGAAAGETRANPDYVRFDAAVQRPRSEHVAWLLAQMRASGQLGGGHEDGDEDAPREPDGAGLAAAAAAIYRPDLFDAA